jgi:hypothetical protein
MTFSIETLEREAELLFVSPQGKATIGGHTFDIRDGERFKGHDPMPQSDEDIWKDLMVPLYREVVEESGVDHTTEDGPELGGLADGMSLLEGMGRLLTTPTKIDGDEQPGLSQLEATRVIQGWMMGDE